MDDGKAEENLDVNKDPNSSSSDDELDFSSVERNAISNKLRIGYFSMDRANQTQVSDILDLKATTRHLCDLVEEVKKLKKDLIHSKQTLQASYEKKIHARAFELYARINAGLFNQRKKNEKRFDQVRHSFRAQLQNTVLKISRDYEQMYTGLSQQERQAHEAKMLEIQRSQAEQKKSQAAQEGLIEMMRLQMESSSPVPIDAEKVDSAEVCPAAYLCEIEQLTDTVAESKLKIKNLNVSLTEAEKENQRLDKELDIAQKLYMDEKKKYNESRKTILDLQVLLEKERKASKRMLEDQKANSQKNFQAEMEAVKEKAKLESSQKLKAVQEQQEEKLKKQELLAKKETEKALMEARRLSAADEDELAKLREIVEKQEQEIVKLTKDIKSAKRAHDMKVNVLLQKIHALKDEMFLRASLQRQAANVRFASVMYKEGSEGTTAVVQPHSASITHGRSKSAFAARTEHGYEIGKSLTSDAINRSPTQTRRANLLQRNLASPVNSV